MKDLRVEVRTRNNVLWHVIFDQYRSVAAFCRAHELHQQIVGDYLNLTNSPYGKDGLRPTAQQLCSIAGLDSDALFPVTLYEGVVPNRYVAEVESRRFLPLAAAGRLALPANQDTIVNDGELARTMSATLETLTPREGKMLRLRYGLNGEDEHTLEELGAQFSVGKERVRQIILMAMRKLRRPNNLKRLQPFLEKP